MSRRNSDVSSCADALNRVRRLSPRIHCVVNSAAATLGANALLAVGAEPSLTLAEEEIEDFVRSADALLINIGTMDKVRERAIELALEVAIGDSKRWVLDPVMIDRSPVRLERAKRLIRSGPDVIRGNGAEIGVLASELGLATAAELAESTGAVVVQSGPADAVCCDRQVMTVYNGHPWMSRATAVGCAGGALVAAFLGLGGDPFRAAWRATLILGVSGEIAASQVQGPGSLQFGLLDVLNELSEDQLLAHANFQWVDGALTSGKAV